jgi:hypothetical protein
VRCRATGTLSLQSQQPWPPSRRGANAKLKAMQPFSPQVLMPGPLARRLPTILRAMTLAEAIETTPIPHVTGRTGSCMALVTTRPYRAPHTISNAGLIGGDRCRCRAGGRAHLGVCCLDERPACRRHVLAVLRQPLEDSALYRQFRECLLPHRARRHCRTGCTPHNLAPTMVICYHDALSQGLRGTSYSS